ncbi:FUSC family protein [Vibrio sp. YMD68]|uniref:FUSC family protein n=1 Tax=Vibrio sp. YMD68 TaxID=3042300 RepID=UPI002499E908|nr:FUSC family protein [Vibrio sp. YMD68]WGV98004.1 FUSC family protein [Vibrio sp. YMD68]
MYSESSKEAIKVGIAVSLAIITALWLGWDKPYWAAITVFIVAANESYSHAVKKGQNRILGTILGTGYATFLLIMFAQDHALFVFFLTMFLALCVFMSSHNRLGYAFTIGFVVCTIISCIGGFDSVTTFNIAVLRFQETLLGVIVYTLVFRFIWPRKTEDLFFSLIRETLSQLHQCAGFELDPHRHGKADSARRGYHHNLNTRSQWKENQNEQHRRLAKLNDILSLPLNGSHRLHEERATWRLIVRAITQIDFLLDVHHNNPEQSGVQAHIAEGHALLSLSLMSPKSTHAKLSAWLMRTETDCPRPDVPSSAFALPLKQRILRVVKAVSIQLTCFALWVLLPMPGGYIMPMVASIFANVLVTLPDNAIKHASFGVLAWGAIFLGEYVLIMPELTQAWQLSVFYFVNSILVWKVGNIPDLAIQKVLGGNLLVVFTMGALQLTPSYEIVTPLVMITCVLVTLGVSSFYIRLFKVRTEPVFS